jgi:hypothetical protein
LHDFHTEIAAGFSYFSGKTYDLRGIQKILPAFILPELPVKESFRIHRKRLLGKIRTAIADML